MDFTIGTILYSTDLGPNGPYVARYTAGLAEKFGAKVYVLHVVEPIGQFAGTLVERYMSEDTLKSWHDRGFEEVREEMRQRVDKFCRDNMMTDEELERWLADILIVEGRPASTILKEAKRINADLIVMGKRGHSALDEVLIGSVARKITMASPVPVLLVPIPE